MIVGTNFYEASAYKIEYEIYTPRIKNTPLVCVIEPDPQSDQYLDEDYVKRLLKETDISISEWETQLKQKAIKKTDKDKWEINYTKIPLYEQENYPYDNCDVFIQFQAKPANENDFYKKIGESEFEIKNTGRTNIIIYYADIKYCVSQDKEYYYYDPCYTDSPRITPQIGTVIRHEFGHALGLGHYVSDDADLNLSWASGLVDAPSIMVIFSHENTKLNKLKTIDIDKVYSIYGNDGFSQNRDSEVKSVFGFLKTSKSEYIKSKLDNEIVTIFGNVTADKMKGQFVTITLEKPDGTVEEIRSILNSNKTFNTQFMIHEWTPIGIYRFNASYIGYDSDELTFEILEQTFTEPSANKIPRWIKTTAKWWSMSKISDNDFVEGIKYLIEEEIIKIQPAKQEEIGYGRQIPEWIKTTAGWWAEGLVPEDDFIKGMQYLIQNGIIRLR